MKKTAVDVIREAFESKRNIKLLFAILYDKSPVGKKKFQQIAESYGQDVLMNSIDAFIEFAEKVGFSGIRYDDNQGNFLDYEFDSLFGIENMPQV